MKNKQFLLSILSFCFVLLLNAQNLPEAWSISSDGKMLTTGGEHNHGFYGQYEMQNVELEFLQSNWWELLDDNYDTGTDLLATCWINGIQYDSVGVRFKGATSFFKNNTEKKSFNITLDYMINGQDIDGYNTFNLNCGWGDNTSMREVLYNNIGQNYYMSLKSNYTNLTINGMNWGPYQSVQQFDSDYIKEWFISNDGTIWRAERKGGGGGPGGGGPMFGAGTSTLNYNGPDSTDYNTDYVLKRTEQNDPWADLITACEVLNNEPLASLEQKLSPVLDIDKACWFLAHENVFADDDSYINKGGSDYYVYYDAETSRIIPMEYDGNSVLGGNHLNWDLFYKENNTDFPLLNRMLAVPSIRQRYLAHVRTILEDYFNPSYADPKIDIWADLIDEFIQDDPKKFYNYNQFQNSIIALKQAIITRRNTLLNNEEMSDVQSLIVDEVSYAVDGAPWQTPTAGDEVDVVVQVSGQVEIASVWLYFGEGLTGLFSKTEMYDDGLHNDGAALDGQFGGVIPPFTSGAYVRYYIEAIADDEAFTATYEPKGAEHNVFIYQTKLESVSNTPIVINELMADNETAIADDYEEFDDWLELYNISSATIDLTGWTLTDDINELDKFSFPTGTMLEPNNYLVIWADDDEEQGDLHANFKLSANGEKLYLLNNIQELVDEVEFPEAIEDLSYSRVPNGTGPFEYQNQTIGANNDLPLSVHESTQNLELHVYPNPATNHITIDIVPSKSSISSIQILNVNGQIVYSIGGEISNKHDIDLKNINAGTYCIRLETSEKLTMKKFIKI